MFLLFQILDLYSPSPPPLHRVVSKVIFSPRAEVIQSLDQEEKQNLEVMRDFVNFQLFNTPDYTRLFEDLAQNINAT